MPRKKKTTAAVFNKMESIIYSNKKTAHVAFLTYPDF